MKIAGGSSENGAIMLATNNYLSFAKLEDDNVTVWSEKVDKQKRSEMGTNSLSNYSSQNDKTILKKMSRILTCLPQSVLNKFITKKYENEVLVVSINGIKLIVVIIMVLVYILDKIFLNINLPLCIYILYFLFDIIVTSVILKKSESTLKLHASEHMVIKFYRKYNYVPKNENDINLLKKCSRFDRGCGTTSVVSSFFWIVIFNILFRDFMLGFCIGFIFNELWDYFGNNKIIKICSFPIDIISSVLQVCLFTAKPSDKELNIAIHCLNNLEHLESTYES